MEHAKTLWMLDYCVGKGSHLVPIYAEDEQKAWVEAYCWATRHQIVLPEEAMLVHFPHGFTVHTRTLPGRIEGSASERRND